MRLQFNLLSLFVLISLAAISVPLVVHFWVRWSEDNYLRRYGVPIGFRIVEVNVVPFGDGSYSPMQPGDRVDVRVADEDGIFSKVVVSDAEVLAAENGGAGGPARLIVTESQAEQASAIGDCRLYWHYER